MFLGENGEHLHLDGLHLIVQLLETRHLAPVPMYPDLQQTITHLDQHRVNIEGLVPGRQELTEIIVTVPLDMGVIVPGHLMDLPPLHWPVGLEHPQCIRVGGHMD